MTLIVSIVRGRQVVTANERWGQMLAAWAIPKELLDAATVSPYFFDPKIFAGSADETLERVEDTVSDRVARAALPAHGTVLDVGVGAGAASLRLGAGRIIGVDPNRDLLHAFVERATRRGIDATPVEGTWPDVAADVEPADVVVCHHVLYNVADLAAFARALADHARHRVVIEITAVHPLTWMTPYWQALHRRSQPDRPTADDALAVLAELGIAASQERWWRPMQMIGERGDEAVERIARRLCLSADRHDELRDLLDAVPPPREREVVTIWW